MSDTGSNTLLDDSIGHTAPSWRDYLEMCKPRVVLLMLLCSLVGMFLATPAMVPWDVLIFGNLGIALVAGSAAAMNHLLDARIDSVMARTKNRPMALGKVSNTQGGIFVGVTGILGLAILAVLINPLTAWLNLASWIGYGVVYTVYLKRATPQNIVIGGIFGAAPPLFGWTAVTNSIDPGGLLLVLIIFAWTPPHFLGPRYRANGRIQKSRYSYAASDAWRGVHKATHTSLHDHHDYCIDTSVSNWHE